VSGPVRWAIDKGSPDDPQQRSWLVLFYEGKAASWWIVDQNGAFVLLVPISGSGVAGRCATQHGGAGISVTWRAVDSTTLARFQQSWPTLRAIGEGPNHIGVRTELADTACRASDDPSAYFDAPPVSPYTWTRDGKAVSWRELSSRAGLAHCDWESATFLSIGWPVGTVSDTAAQTRQYIRDPRGAVRAALRDRLRLRAELPADAGATGYRYGPLEVYLSPSDQDEAIYVVGGGRVERWPRSEPMALCV
jgi:hypothetical protein